MSAVDTNVLLYIHDPRDSRKQRAAVELVSSLPNAVLLWQVACEFVNAVRKLRDESFGPLEAWAELQQLRRVWPLAMPTPNCLTAAVRLIESHSLSLWDALLLAACAEAGVRTLYSEDLSDRRTYGGVHIHNPFL